MVLQYSVYVHVATRLVTRPVSKRAASLQTGRPDYKPVDPSSNVTIALVRLVNGPGRLSAEARNTGLRAVSTMQSAQLLFSSAPGAVRC